MTKIYLERPQQPQIKMGTLPIRASLAKAEEMDQDLLDHASEKGSQEELPKEQTLIKNQENHEADEDDEEEDEDEDEDEDDDQQPLNNETTATLSSGSITSQEHVEQLQSSKEHSPELKDKKGGAQSHMDTESDEDEDEDEDDFDDVNHEAKDGAVAAEEEQEDGWWY